MIGFAMLLNVAELSSVVPAVLVIICFCAMLLFITRNMIALRMHGEDMVFQPMHHQVPARVPQINMMKVHIPFTFKLLETSKSTYSDIQCNVSSQVNCRVQVYWGVNIKELHIFLWKPWSALREKFLDRTFLKGQYQHEGPEIALSASSDEKIRLSLTEALDLGTPPRLCYPLVIFIFRTEKEGDIHPDETVALINVVHVKDAVCSLSTSVLAQYLKQANGQLSCLKQLYLATGNSGNYNEEIPFTVAEPVDGNSSPMVCPSGDGDSMWNAAGEQLCVVCQYFPLSRALLPCRHTCICASCFEKLARCPMCRSPIKSYFCIRGEDYMPIQTPTSKTQQDGQPAWVNRLVYPYVGWIDNVLDRLIDFLGFQR